MSANVSYERAAEEVTFFTGIRVSAKTQQRLVHRQTNALPVSQTPVNEVSVDGGNVRLRTPLKQPCEWRNYKAVCLHQVAVNAWFGQNEKLVDWVNQQPLANILTCLGDGHAGVWNLIALFTPPERRREILDWYHR